MKRFQLMVGALTLLTLTLFVQTSQAHPNISFGIRFGPGYHHYGPRPHYYYAYPYYPYYYAPPPVVYDYETVPRVIVRQQPAVIDAIPSTVVPSPPSPPPPPAPTVIPAQNIAPGRADMLMAKLNDPSETVRRDAAMDLGRMKALKAVDALAQVLAKDASPIARDGAARALGLIAAPRSLNALIYAAQADNDRDVRHSAQFAVEIIRTNLRGN